MATVDSLKGQLQTTGGNKPQQTNTLQSMTSNPKIIERFTGILGSETKANRFLASIIALSNDDKNLQKCNPTSVINCCMLASTLNLSLQKSLGHAYVIGYGGNAQLQLGYKGLLMLAMNSGCIKKINAIALREGQLKLYDPLFEEIEIDFEGATSDVITGFVGVMELMNGFNKIIYVSDSQMKEHGKKYGKTNPMWSKEYEKMGQKTILKKLLKYAPLSFDIQNVINADGGTPKNIDDMNDLEHMEVEYPDAIEVDSNLEI